MTEITEFFLQPVHYNNSPSQIFEISINFNHFVLKNTQNIWNYQFPLSSKESISLLERKNWWEMWAGITETKCPLTSDALC